MRLLLSRAGTSTCTRRAASASRARFPFSSVRSRSAPRAECERAADLTGATALSCLGVGHAGIYGGAFVLGTPDPAPRPARPNARLTPPYPPPHARPGPTPGLPPAPPPPHRRRLGAGRVRRHVHCADARCHHRYAQLPPRSVWLPRDAGRPRQLRLRGPAPGPAVGDRQHRGLWRRPEPDHHVRLDSDCDSGSD